MIKVYDTGAALVDEHRAVLESHPLESGFFYLDARFLQSTDKQNYALAVTEGEKTLLSMKLIPYNMILTGDRELVGELLDFLLAEGYELDSVLCNETLGEALCAAMSEKTHIEYYEALAMDYMESRDPYAPTDGEVESAVASDERELRELLNLFAEECGLEERIGENDDLGDLSAFRIIRRHSQIAAMAKLSADTDVAKRVSDVYTRPAYRGQNLASKVVNAVKNAILEEGYVADLNVDQRNPVTNYLYRKLGFERVFAQGQYRPALVHTERLRLRVLSDREMEALIECESDEGMKLAYGEMLSLSKAKPRDRVFAAVWLMERKTDGTALGDLCFKGIGEDGTLEIGYGTYEPYQNQGYTTEAVTALTRWALQQGCVKRVEAETEAENLASQRVLEKSGFVPNGIIGEEGPRFVWKGELP